MKVSMLPWECGLLLHLLIQDAYGESITRIFLLIFLHIRQNLILSQERFIQKEEDLKY